MKTIFLFVFKVALVLIIAVGGSYGDSPERAEAKNKAYTQKEQRASRYINFVRYSNYLDRKPNLYAAFNHYFSKGKWTYFQIASPYDDTQALNIVQYTGLMTYEDDPDTQHKLKLQFHVELDTDYEDYVPYAMTIDGIKQSEYEMKSLLIQVTN